MKPEQLASIFEAVRVMTLRPSDVLVFRANIRLSRTQEETIREQLEEKFGSVNILILDSAGDIAVVRHEEDPRPPSFFARLFGKGAAANG